MFAFVFLCNFFTVPLEFTTYLTKSSAILIYNIIWMSVRHALCLLRVVALDGILIDVWHILRIEVRPFCSTSHALILLVEWSEAQLLFLRPPFEVAHVSVGLFAVGLVGIEES